MSGYTRQVGGKESVWFIQNPVNPSDKGLLVRVQMTQRIQETILLEIGLFNTV